MANSFFHKPGASKRLEALTDGIFAIAATLLVLEIRVPELEPGYTREELWRSLQKILPSFIAFVFSFLNIMVFWMNHDAIGKVVRYFDRKLTCFNLVFLLLISLIPFTTKMVSDYPGDLAAITLYGIVLMLCSVLAVIMYHHIAFASDLMSREVPKAHRKKVWKTVVWGPVLFIFAIAMGLISVYIPIIIYILTPVLFLFLPGMDLNEISEKETHTHS